MASRGRKNSSGGGCITSIFIVALIISALQEYAIVLLIIGVLIVIAAIAVNNSNYNINKTETYNNQVPIGTTNIQHITNPSASVASSETRTQSFLNVTTSDINSSMIEGYKNKLAFRKKVLSNIESLTAKRNRLGNEIYDQKVEISKLTMGTNKPFYMTYKKFIEKKQPEIDSLCAEKEENEKRINDINLQIQTENEVLKQTKYNLFEESNPAFEALRNAFEQLKKSANIVGDVNIKESKVTSLQQNSDLKYVYYKTKPYALSLGNLRFYFFPRSIWAFYNTGELAGIYKPKAINCLFQSKEVTDYGYRFGGKRIFSDTTILRTVKRWRYERNDGGPDMRYKDNPRVTYTTYIQCNIDIDICGCLFKFLVSSENNCVAIERAIKNYSELTANKDVIPILLALLDNCATGDDIKKIKELMAAQ